MRDLVRKVFVENAAVKAVALILSITLFILVRGDKETERTIRVGVAYVKPRGRDVLAPLPEYISVQVRGPWTRIKRLDEADIDAIVVDLGKMQGGEMTFAEDQIRLPPGLHVVSIRPPRVAIEFAEDRTVPVAVQRKGEPKKGFRLERLVVSPESVTLHGAQDAVEALAVASTGAVDLGAPFPQRVPLVGLPPEVKADVEEIEVNAVLVEEETSRKLTGVRVVVRPPAGMTEGALKDLVSVEPSRVDIVVRGKLSQLDGLDPSQVVAIVEVHTEDIAFNMTRPARVLIEGVPSDIWMNVEPKNVILAAKLVHQ